MAQSKDLRVPILLLVPFIVLISWLILPLLSDLTTASGSSAETEAVRWDLTNLQILPHYSSQKDVLESVFQLEKIPVNKAGAELLTTIPGIGPELAKRIVNDRDQFGPITDPGELSRVRGIGPKRALQFQSYLRFD